MRPTTRERSRDAAASLADDAVLDAIRAGDERAFEAFVERHHGSLYRVACGLVRERTMAEEIVQQCWLGFLEGIHRFEGRSSLRTYLFHTLANTARARLRKEGRSLPFSSLVEGDEPAVDPSRFEGPESPWAGHWTTSPKSFGGSGEDGVLRAELAGVLGRAVEDLPEAQRSVFVLRDVEGLETTEICELLGLGEANVRVLLHRARAKLRAAVEAYSEGSP